MVEAGGLVFGHAGGYAPANARAADVMRLTTLKRSAEFQRVRGGARVATALFVLETKTRAPETQDGSGGPRVGFTITKKIGSAVTRNRIRRRLKEIFRGLGDGDLMRHHDYVLIARAGIDDVPFADLRTAIGSALRRLAAESGRRNRPSGAGSENGKTGQLSAGRESRRRRDSRPRNGGGKTPL